MRLFGFEIKRIKKRKKTQGFSRRQWTKSETDTLLRLRNEGKNWKEIASLMNRTDAACYSRYHKVKGKRA